MKHVKLACVAVLWCGVSAVWAQDADKPTAATVSQELPKVMYVVPWKKADDSGFDETGRPQSLILGMDLNVIDPLQHRRQVHFERIWRAANPAPATK
ncbi:MAG: hypothetical protein ACK4F8_05460 [Aquabacterium sp.]